MRTAAISGAPRLPRTYVPRPRLWEHLDRATRGAVTVLVAPVGAGKTMGVSGWLRARAAESDATWIHADATWEPNRLGRMLDRRSRADPAGSYHGDRPALVVIDDAYRLPPASLRMIDDLLHRAPDSIRLLLVSRWDLPLTKMVPELLGHYATVRGGVLRMDEHEVSALVHAHAGSSAPAVVDAIAAHAQGWCAALVLAARAVAAAPDKAEAARLLAGGESSLADRVASEAFAALRPEERHVLLCVAREGTVTSSAAIHLSHDRRAADTLAQLEDTGLLVTRADEPVRLADGHGPDPTYRIHPLLAEVVRRRLASGGVDVERARATIVRAVRLDLASGDGAHAFDRLVGVHAIEEAAEVLATQGVTLVMCGDGEAIATFVRAHPDVIDTRPATWFAVALDRWIADDISGAHHWIARVLDHLGTPAHRDEAAVVSCLTLMGARLGLISMETAVADAQALVDGATAADHVALPYLCFELGVTQGWTGDLVRAEENLATAVELCRRRGVLPLAVAATSHLALTEYMAGRERAAVEVAIEALSLLGTALPHRTRFASTRATLALLLGSLVDVPLPAEILEAPDRPPRVHTADLCTRFWLRIRDARLALLAGSPADAERLLASPIEVPAAASQLPRHLQVAVLVERAFLAALVDDHDLLRDLERKLTELGVRGEAALVGGLRADVLGDRRAAAAAFGTAAREAVYDQPPSRALALVCQAQLVDALGEHDSALERLREAAHVTEVRRNAVPFLGWIRQGTPVETLLARLSRADQHRGSTWVRTLASATSGRPDVTAMYAPIMPTPHERSADTDVYTSPPLSPREREVLRELARGATYADIAARLFVSENTVKTHVSSLYAKLAVSRRSEALAVARTFRFL